MTTESMATTTPTTATTSVASAVTTARPRVWRSVGAVVAGFATTFILSSVVDAVLHGTGVFPPYGERMGDGLFVLAAAYRALFTVGGGVVTAHLAPQRPMKHALILAAIGSVAGAVGMAVSLAHPEMGPTWYAVFIFVSAFPCVCLGAKLSRRA